MENTDITFYGTGAADGIPNPFCRCATCQNARITGGAERRRRSMLRLSATHGIDLGPDAADAALAYGELASLEHVLLTHTHEDHFYYGLIETRTFASPAPKTPLHLYLTGEAFALAAHLRDSATVFGGKLARYEERGLVAFHQLHFGRQVSVAGVGVLPLRGNHTGNLGEAAANYLVTLPNGTTLYYGVDTGWYLPETLDALAGRALDILISECTWGAKQGRGEQPKNHLDIYSSRALFDVLLAQGTLAPHSRIYLTHINHKNGATHADLTQWAKAQRQDFPCPITVAQDGLTEPGR